MRLVRTFAATAMLCALSMSAGAQDTLSSRFCLVPVRDGTPTARDIGQAWRLVSRIIALPGVPRPVIYTVHRGGVWTIDETRTFVPFGGEFPTGIFDRFARDPDTGRIAGASRSGVYALDPGETQFKKLHEAGNKTRLRHIYSIEFIPRMEGFVVADAKGLFLLNRAGELSELPVSDATILATPFRTFDLPSFGALLINAQDSHAVVRYDDGEIVRVATFDRNDYATDVTVKTDGMLSVRGRRGVYAVRLGRKPTGPIVQRQRFDIESIRMPYSRGRLDAPSIGKVLQMHALSGLFEIRADGREPLRLPFDASREPIEALTELPASQAVLIFTQASAYVLNAEGAIAEVSGARSAGYSRLGAVKGIIPVRNEMIVLGAKALHLLLDARFAGPAACRTAG